MTRSLILIGIAGASCSGKSTLAKHLTERLPPGSTTVICLDNYFRDLSHLSMAERSHHNFDHPDALDSVLFEAHVQALSLGETIEVPIYDFTTHCRTGNAERVDPAQFVIVEGIFALHKSAVRRFFTVSAFIESDPALCLARRIARDTRERGRTEEDVRRQFYGTVLPMYYLYVKPTSAHADLVIVDKDMETSATMLLMLMRQT